MNEGLTEIEQQMELFQVQMQKNIDDLKRKQESELKEKNIREMQLSLEVEKNYQ